MAFGTSSGQAGRWPSTIAEALNRDWDEQVSRHRGSVRRWSLRHGALAKCGTLTDVLHAASGHSDAILGALLTEVSNDDHLAGRVVLQALIGRVVRMANRDRAAGVDDYVSALWCQILTYPLAARPVRIAANLSLDTLKAVVRERRWIREGEVTPWPPEVLWDERNDHLLVIERPQHELSANRILRVGVDRGVIDQAAQQLLVSVYIDGLSGAETADRHWTSEGSVRVRCSRAVGRLAAHRDQLLAEVA